MEKRITDLISQLRVRNPLVYNITNYVAMNNSANALLAVGASPIMSFAPEEAEDLVKLCGATVINIGTLDPVSVRAMMIAVRAANQVGRPVVLDPVGAGATAYRDTVVRDLLNAAQVGYIRGNASEIQSVIGVAVASRGVDASVSSLDSVAAAVRLSEMTGAVVCVSGEVDVVASGRKVGYIRNGSLLMTKVTALGCSATAILGAFAALGANPFDTAIAATALMAVCGELAAEQSAGPGTLQMHLYDALYNVTTQDIESRLNLKIEGDV